MNLKSTTFPFEFYQYEDSELAFVVPKYLRPKKGVRFFNVYGKPQFSYSVLHFAIDTLNKDAFNAQLKNLRRFEPHRVGKSDTLEARIIRYGQFSDFSNSHEVLATSLNISSNIEHHSYMVLWRALGKNFFATFMGVRNVDSFDVTCQTVIKSVSTKEP